MKSGNIVMIMGVIAVVIIGATLFRASSGSGDYVEALLQERKEKDEFMRSNDASPFKNQKVAFTALRYFEPDPAWVITAELEPIRDKQVRVVPTSTGTESRYLEYAWAHFTADGKKCKLLLLEVMDMGPQRGTLFLGFADATSARETYGAGRYLDVRKIAGATTIELDFNKAYNPYCAYTDDYTCPFPPKENVLPVGVRAGEQVYHSATP